MARAFRALLWICFAVSVEGTGKPLKLTEDTTSAHDEALWFNADGHVGFLTRLAFEIAEECTQEYHCIDCFGASGNIRKCWTKKAFAATSYDIKINAQHDITSFSGCVLLIEMLLKLLPFGILVCGPPCSLFVSACQSVHTRSLTNIYGNTRNLRVRCANAIWTNFAIIMLVVRKVRQDIKVLIEQPSSSWAFHLPEMKRVIAAWSMRRITTWMGLFSHDLLKCSHLMVSESFRTGDSLARKMTAEKRKVIKERFAKRQSRRKTPKEYYKRTATGWAGGKNLPDSAAYTPYFCAAVLKAWKADCNI